MTTNSGHLPVQVDYDLHGIVGIRLIDAMPGDVAAVTRQLGPIQAVLEREPDIIIRFVDHLSTTSQIRYLGLDDAGFTDDAFLVLRGKHETRVKVQIPIDQVGQAQCEIVCESGLPAVPLLIPILNLTALSKGALPLHASAFIYNGLGVLATGWAKGGKTETLLAFTANGAQYVGDEWVYISSDGQYMHGIPEPIRVWDWHLEDLPQYRALLGRSDRARLRGLNLLVQSLDQVVTSGLGRGSVPVKLMRRVRPMLKRQLYVHLTPQTLFDQGHSPMKARLQKVFFVASHESPEVTLTPIEPGEIARRMVFSLQEERSDFLSYYLKFRFAFPEAHNPFIEQAEECQRQALLRVLADKETYAVYHPYPVPIPAMFEVISPLLTKQGSGSEQEDPIRFAPRIFDRGAGGQG